MKEILFRGKRKDNGEWVYGTPLYLIHERYKDSFTMIVPLNTEFGCGELDDFYEVIPETVGQYRGLNDKNGQKIFEGDILEIAPRKSNTAPTVLLVVTDVFKTGEYFRHGVRYWQVIGNIHDNPELLKGGE